MLQLRHTKTPAALPRRASTSGLLQTPPPQPAVALPPSLTQVAPVPVSNSSTVVT